jgi:DNA adenine methylase
VGSGAVFFHLRPPQAVLSDSNLNLIAVYQHIQSHLDELLSLLYEIRSTYHALSPQQQEQEYYRVREMYNALPFGTVQKSAFLIFLNKTGYNGLYRESKRGGYNVPFGRYDNPALFDEANLGAVSQALQGAEIMHADFSHAVQSAQEGDFVYFDPPYVPLNKTSSFTSYTQGNFAIEQQVQLAEVARRLAENGVQVMLSNSNCDFTRELYQGFYQHEVKASRAINSKADSRGKISELVITSYAV